MSTKTLKVVSPHPLFARIGSTEGVSEFELKKNGLRVLYSPERSVPVVGVMVTYLAGSRHESTGNTGAMHILEHLMFKGSKQFPVKKGACALNLLKKKGGQVNATTWLDRTNYYEVVPTDYFEFALRFEADRMRNAHITQKNLEMELPAVLSEYAMSVENDPFGLLEEQVWATAFHSHPYHHPTIGWRQDVEHVSVQSLKQCYDTYYHPNNAVVTIVGDVSEHVALETVAKYFGVHPRAGHTFGTQHMKEDSQEGKRFVEIQRPGTKNIVTLAFKVPEALHGDTPAVTVLSSVLGGGATSRLHRALVDKKLASSAWASYMPFHDPSLIMLYALPTASVTHESLERAMWRAIERIQEKGISTEELAKVQARMATEIAFARDGHFATLSSLNEAIAVGDWRFFFNLPKLIQKETTERIKTVATTYLHKNRVTVGYYRTSGNSYEV